MRKMKLKLIDDFDGQNPKGTAVEVTKIELCPGKCGSGILVFFESRTIPARALDLAWFASLPKDFGKIVSE